jgi:ATP-dependent DNA helicase RecG
MHLELKHFPASLDDIAQADRRLAFEELFFLILASLSNKKEITQAKSKRIQFKAPEAKEFVAHLPFKLTDAQKEGRLANVPRYGQH